MASVTLNGLSVAGASLQSTRRQVLQVVEKKLPFGIPMRDVKIAIGEFLGNNLKHTGGGEVIDVEIVVERDSMFVTIWAQSHEDHFELLAKLYGCEPSISNAGTLAECGMGIGIIRSIADDVKVFSDGRIRLAFSPKCALALAG